MKRETFWQRQKQHSLFPPSLFFVYLGTLFLMSGVHTGLIVGMNSLGWSDLVQVYIPLLYWGAVAVVLTLFTRRMIRKTYEEPMLRLADATRKVAEGDFSVYVPPVHTADKADYLDRMILDFDKMVEELGSIETLKTDFFSDVSHEFKSPLAVISSNAELLQKSGKLSTDQAEQVENIRYAAKRLANLIQNMLKLNKLEKQTIRPAPETFDVCAQLCECAVQFEEVWERKISTLKPTWRTAPPCTPTPACWKWCGPTCCPTPSSLPRRAVRSPSGSGRRTAGCWYRWKIPAAA